MYLTSFSRLSGDRIACGESQHYITGTTRHSAQVPRRQDHFLVVAEGSG